MPLPLPPRVPGSKPRTLFRFLRDPMGLFEESHRTLGDVFRLPVPGNSEWICICSPDLLRAVDEMSETVVDPGPIKTQITGGLIGNRSLLFLKGEAHRERQKILLHHFTFARLARHIPYIGRLTRELFEARRGEGTAPLLPLFHRLSLKVAARVAFGATFDEPKEMELIDAFQTLTDEGLRSPLAVMPALQKDWGAWSPWGKLVRLARRVRTQFHESIDGAEKAGRIDPESVLGALIEADLDREAVVDEMFSLLFGGHETTGAILTWTVQRLMTDAEVFGRLRAELDAVVEEGGIERDDLRSLPYLSAVVRESLRTSPLGPVGGGRYVTADCELGGYRIPAGSTLVYGLHAMLTRSEPWQESGEFRPERFLDPAPGSAKAWVPFGAGRRICTGKSLALLEIQVVIGTVVQNFDLAGEVENARGERQGLVLAPAGGLPVRVEARDDAISPPSMRPPSSRPELAEPATCPVSGSGVSRGRPRREDAFRPAARGALVAESGTGRCPFGFGRVDLSEPSGRPGRAIGRGKPAVAR